VLRGAYNVAPIWDGKEGFFMSNDLIDLSSVDSYNRPHTIAIQSLGLEQNLGSA
jgi:hypothetical protein